MLILEEQYELNKVFFFFSCGWEFTMVKIIF